VPFILVERVSYEDRDPWPDETDGTGLALQRLRPEAFGNDPINWIAADPTPGRELIRIDSIAILVRSVVVRFRQVAGRSYTLQYRNSLTQASWLTLADYPAQGTTVWRETSDPVPSGNAARFYRLVSPLQP